MNLDGWLHAAVTGVCVFLLLVIAVLLVLVL